MTVQPLPSFHSHNFLTASVPPWCAYNQPNLLQPNNCSISFHLPTPITDFLPSLITLWVTNHGGNKHVPAVFITFQTVYLVVACCLPAFPHLALFSKMFFSELHPPRGLCFHPCLFVCLLAGLSAVLHKNYWTDFNKSWREDVSRSRIVFTLQGRAVFLHFH